MPKKLVLGLVICLLMTPSALRGQDRSSWSATAGYWRDRNGERITFSCPSTGSARTVWGTNIYTDDSSVCTAAVHDGVITVASGGTVTIEIRSGRSSYNGSLRNGVSSSNWGSWNGSFVIAGGEAGRGGGGGGVGNITWSGNAIRLRNRNGERFTFSCPPGGSVRAVWGSGTYSDDSSICSAAVHDGVIGFTSGGTVTIEIRAGLSSYRGSRRNGVTTGDWGAWSGSFVIVSGDG